MPTLAYILIAGTIISAIALVGAATVLVGTAHLRIVLLPLVAFAAGTLMGSALLHMLPAASAQYGGSTEVYLAALAGFGTFFFIEQFLQWRHCPRDPADARQPLTYLVLLGDALHNFLDGVTVAAAFLIDPRIGLSAAIAVAAHEIPQELGDFAILVHGGWSRKRALLFNFATGLTFLVGSLTVYFAAATINVGLLLPFAAGTFLYIAASDLIPEVRAATSLGVNIAHSICFTAGIALLWLLLVLLEA
jgi:zinc and cadmium transporter